MICRCLAVSNQTRTTRSASSSDEPRGVDVPGAGFANLYSWPREIVSQPLVVFKEAAEFEF